MVAIPRCKAAGAGPAVPTPTDGPVTCPHLQVPIADISFLKSRQGEKPGPAGHNDLLVMLVTVLVSAIFSISLYKFSVSYGNYLNLLDLGRGCMVMQKVL